MTRITDRTRRIAEQTVASSFNTADAELRMQEAAEAGRNERLDAFLALTSEGRARAWRALSNEQRRELVIAQGQRLDKFVCESWIEQAIETWNTKWAAEPSSLETATAGAFENASEEIERAARYARQELEAIDNDRRALGEAKKMAAAGIWPEQVGNGVWKVASSRGTAFYQVNRLGACTCPDAMHRHRTCKHAWLVRIAEQASEVRAAHDDYTPDDDYARAARKALGRRLSVARRVYVEAI